MKAQGPKGVTAYLATVPVDARGALQKLRNAIRAAAPGTEEGFSYGCRPSGLADDHSFATRRPRIIAASTR